MPAPNPPPTRRKVPRALDPATGAPYAVIDPTDTAANTAPKKPGFLTRILTDKLMKPILTSLVRHALTALGGFLVSKGLLENPDTLASSGVVETVVGGALFLIGQAWSLIRTKATPK